MLLWAILLVALGDAKKVIVPPLDPFDFPDKLYQPVADPNQSILDRSMAEDALDWKQYQVEFHRTPATEESDFTVTGADGMEYACFLPSSHGATTEEACKVGKHGRRKLKKWSKALDPLRKKTLLFRSGWWVYEFVYQKHILQYHVLSKEEQAMRPGIQRDEFLLGRYVPGQSSDELDFTGSKLSQNYLFGDECQLPDGQIGAERQTLVKFRCDAASKIDYIEKVEEVSICRYVIVIATPRVCHLVTDTKASGLIQCYPSKTPFDSGLVQEPHPKIASETDHLSEEDRLKHRKRQHSMLKHVVSKSGFLQFNLLINELLDEVESMLAAPSKALPDDDDDSDGDQTEADDAVHEEL